MERVLIIEDDAAMLRGLKDNFELKGYEVRTARDGESGFDSAVNGSPHLIVLDVMLPGMNGFEICRRLRKANIQTPIVMLTAKTEESDVVMGLNLGADDYVTKPFSIKELMARAEALLRRRRAGEHRKVRFGDCEMDFDAGRLARAGREVELSPTESALLRFFIEHSNHALTRDQILDGVWGYDRYVIPRSVDRFVTTLRAKIEPDPENPRFVRTVREIGYRFELEEENGSAAARREPKADKPPAGRRNG